MFVGFLCGVPSAFLTAFLRADLEGTVGEFFEGAYEARSEERSEHSTGNPTRGHCEESARFSEDRRSARFFRPNEGRKSRGERQMEEGSMRRNSFPIMTFLLAASILAVYGLELSGNGLAMCERFGFVAAHPGFGTALSSLFVHDPAGWSHVGGNLAVLLIVGTLVEREIGSRRFGGLFAVGGLCGAGLHLVADPASTTALVGCSGSLFAVLAVAAALYGPAMLAFVAVLVVTNVAHALGAPGEAAVSFGAHLGGFSLGVLVVALARLRGVELHRRARRAGGFATV
jgi:membrane associated rhomboid family serine protease